MAMVYIVPGGCFIEKDVIHFQVGSSSNPWKSEINNFINFSLIEAHCLQWWKFECKKVEVRNNLNLRTH